MKDRLNELQREVRALQGTKSPAVPPLILRHQNIIRDCLRLNDTLDKNRIELERLRSVFQTIWQEQLYRIHVEQDIFQSQVYFNDLKCLILRLILFKQIIYMIL